MAAFILQGDFKEEDLNIKILRRMRGVRRQQMVTV
jgi:hypothetical protein